MSDHLLTAVNGPVATCTLNRPEARNALSDEMVEGLREFLVRIERDDAVRCVVITGAGEHFQSGGDVKRFSALFTMPAKERQAFLEHHIQLLHPVIVTMRRMRKPVLASVQGACAGFGLSLAMACDMIIAGDSAYFSLAYINIGTSPDGSGTYFLPRLVGMKRAMEIALLGERFDAKTALAIGLINRVVPAAALAAETEKLGLRLASGPTHAMGNTKALLNASLERSLESQLQAEAVSFAECSTTADMGEGVKSFVEKRKPEFRGR